MTIPQKRLSSQITEDHFERTERINSKLAMADVAKLYEVGQKCQLFQEYKRFADSVTWQLTAFIPTPTLGPGSLPTGGSPSTKHKMWLQERAGAQP